MVILIASVSAAVAYFIAGAIPGLRDTSTKEKVSTMEVIRPEIADVDKQVFNANALNPTIHIEIGSDSTTTSSGMQTTQQNTNSAATKTATGR